MKEGSRPCFGQITDRSARTTRVFCATPDQAAPLQVRRLTFPLGRGVKTLNYSRILRNQITYRLCILDRQITRPFLAQSSSIQVDPAQSSLTTPSRGPHPDAGLHTNPFMQTGACCYLSDRYLCLDSRSC